MPMCPTARSTTSRCGRRKGRSAPNSADWQPWLVVLPACAGRAGASPEPQGRARKARVLAALPELSLQIVEFAREHGRITMGDAIRLTGGNRNTLKQHFRALVEQGQPGSARRRQGRLVRVAIGVDSIPGVRHQKQFFATQGLRRASPRGGRVKHPARTPAREPPSPTIRIAR
jgi:hypothetical protein